jgi:hypothetical protein
MNLIKTLAICFAAALALASPVFAENPTAGNLKGSWVRESDGIKLTFEYKEKNVLELTLDRDGGKIVIDCDYGIGRDRSVFCRVQEIKEGNANIGKGDTFSFQLDVNKDKASMSELKSKDSDSDMGRQIKMIIEGEYTKK